MRGRTAPAEERVESLDADLCYRALGSRDARFDGRFFVGVLTTGVYCRPVCPARTPRRENVRFFACAAAAHAAGYRPCLRCRPEVAPGTAAWLGTSATVSRALRLITAGALRDDGVERLAERVGVGERHLRRLFLRHLGASPLAFAQTERLHFAKRLIDETTLPMTRVAFEAGFASVRRFNATIKNTYGQTPRALRRLRSPGSRLCPGGALELRLSFRPPLDWAMLADFLARRAIPGVERVEDGVYRRTVSLGGGAGVLEVAPAAGAPFLTLRLPIELAGGVAGAVGRVRRLFDLGAPPSDIGVQLRRDPLLAPRWKRHPGVRVPGAWDGFELAVRAVLGQQVSVAGATTLAGRLVERFGTPLGAAARPGLTHLFPAPAVLADADVACIGLPGARAETIRAVARAVCEGTLPLDDAAPPEDTIDRLVGLSGIGAWTASYIAMRALGEPDAFPEQDLGLRKVLAQNGGLAPVAEVRRRAEAWRPWRAYAAMLLWREEPPMRPTRRSR